MAIALNAYVDIANMALTRIGHDPIQTLDVPNSNKKEVDLCRQFMRQVYLENLRNHPWKRATKRTTLSESSGTPLYHWDKHYDLPVDCVRVLTVNDNHTKFSVEGQKLVTNYTEAKIMYTADVPPGEMDPLAVRVIYLELAQRIAYALTLSDRVTKSLTEEIEMIALPNARHANAMEELEPDADKEQSGWINARYSTNVAVEQT